MVGKFKGFSLIELMVVIAIMGILMGIAAPAVSEWIATQRLKDTAADLFASFSRAKSEAISRGLETKVTPVSGNWASGWYIANPDPVFNPDINNPTVFIEQHGPVTNGTLTGTGTVTFLPVGRLSGSNVALRVAVTGTQGQRCIRLSTAGKVNVVVITASDTCA